MVRMTRLAVGVLTVMFLYTSLAQAQWVFLGRKAIGAVNRLTSQGSDKQGQGYDVATVLLEADADKAYSTAVNLLKGNPNCTVTYREDRYRTIEFTDGKIVAGMKVSRLEENLCQLLISSTGTPGKPSGTSFVVERVFQVCQEMGVQCMLVKD